MKKKLAYIRKKGPWKIICQDEVIFDIRNKKSNLENQKIKIVLIDKCSSIFR
jgi:hypothetical protein